MATPRHPEGEKEKGLQPGAEDNKGDGCSLAIVKAEGENWQISYSSKEQEPVQDTSGAW